MRIAKIRGWEKLVFLYMCHKIPPFFLHDHNVFVAHNKERHFPRQGHGLWGWPASSAMLRI